MNQVIQVNNPDASSSIPAKRKRGRPRKYPKHAEDGARIPKMQRVRWEENAGISGPPGFGGVNGNQSRPVATSSEAADSMVGKAVSGVIEAVFDAGYLLNVRVANSDTTLRGVVFRPGRFVPVSTENDVAPNVQMIRRNEIPVPTEHYNPRPRERKEQQVNPRRDGVASYNAANNLLSKGKQVSSPLVQTTHPELTAPKGNLAPVVLEPGKPSNSLPVATEPAPLETQDSNIGGPSNGSMSTTQVPAFGSDSVLSQLQTSHQLVSDVSAQNKNSTLLDAGTKSSKPFESLVTEVIKRIETPPQPVEAQAAEGKLARNTSVKNEDEANDDQALDIEPLQAVLVNDNSNKLTSSPKPMDVDRGCKMSQLLEVLQGTISESPVAPQMSETPSLVTEQRGTEPGNLEDGTATQASLF